jgi:high-affinity nickel-transport protein
VTGEPWTTIVSIGNFEYTGYLVVGAFILTWALAIVVWRFGRIEERWTGQASAD